MTIIIRRKQSFGVPRGLIGKIEKVRCFALIFKGRLPSAGGVKPCVLHKRCRGKLQRKVSIAVGIWTIRVEVAHINTGEARPVHAVIQIAAAENNIDAAEFFCAHFEHQLRRNGAQKRLGCGTAGIQRIQRNRTVRQERFGLTVDVGGQRGQLLRRNQKILQISAAIFHLFAQNFLRIVIQLRRHLPDDNCADEQGQFNHQHEQQRKEDGEKDRMHFAALRRGNHDTFTSFLACVSKFARQHFRHLFLHFCVFKPRFTASKPSVFILELQENLLETAPVSF